MHWTWFFESGLRLPTTSTQTWIQIVTNLLLLTTGRTFHGYLVYSLKHYKTVPNQTDSPATGTVCNELLLNLSTVASSRDRVRKLAVAVADNLVFPVT
jgi:hypothetical protein